MIQAKVREALLVTHRATRVNREVTGRFDVNPSTEQGDIRGPAVFNFCLNFSTPIKIRIYKAAVLVLYCFMDVRYGGTTQTQMKRFEVFHHRCLRRILKIKWFYHVSNADVLKRANIAPEKGVTVWCRPLQRLGGDLFKYK